MKDKNNGDQPEFQPYRQFSNVDPAWGGISYRDLAKPQGLTEDQVQEVSSTLTNVTILGVGTSTPASTLDVASQTTPQFTITYDTTNKTTFGTDSSGYLTITPSGSQVRLSYLTQGSVVFSGANGFLTQDNTKFFWDDSNDRLGIGTAVPTVSLDVNGDIRDRNMTAGSVLFAGATGVISQDNANLFWDDSNNRLGIGCSNPFYKLEVRDSSGTAHQLLLSKDDDNAASFQVSNTGMIISGYTTGSGELPFVAIENDINGLLEFGVYNTRTTGGGAGEAKILVKNDSTQSGDVYYQLYNGTTIWTHGLDNSDSDSWKLCKGSALGTTDAMIVTTGGAVQLANMAANGQNITFDKVTELTTIAAAATTDTAIQIPLNAVVFAVSVRVTVAIPTAATFTVTGTTSGTQFDMAGGVSVALNTTDVGTRNCPYKNGAAQTIRITPDLSPATNVGRVRVTIHYYTITPATS